MSAFDGWTVIKELGSGGQGNVFLVRSPEGTAQLKKTHQTILEHIRLLAGGLPPQGTTPNERLAHLEAFAEAPRELALAVLNCARENDPAILGALKQFRLPPNGRQTKEAVARFEREVQVLRAITHPSILKLLHANTDRHFMITEYHPSGPLAAQPERYKGSVRGALAAFRTLVEAVAQLHNEKVIHRDIKPPNIFLASDGRLVLGDFGIIFYEDERGDRLTTTFEKVGSRDWMPPWAHAGHRLEDVKPTFDVFMLAKVLWWMISGQPTLPIPSWHRTNDGHNLEVLFPNEPEMALANSLLSQCLVEDEGKCLPTAGELLEGVDRALTIVSRGGQLLEEHVPRPCRVCGEGQYESVVLQHGTIGRSLVNLNMAGMPIHARLFACKTCGHMQLFRSSF